VNLFAGLGRYSDAALIWLGICNLGQSSGFFISLHNVWLLHKENQVKELEAC